MLERVVENTWRKIIKAAGGLYLKFISPGFPGVPDRLVMFPIENEKHREIVKLYIYFIELKRPGATPDQRQKRRHRLFRNMGFHVKVLDRK